jgi:hypothetical protein
MGPLHFFSLRHTSLLQNRYSRRWLEKFVLSRSNPTSRSFLSWLHLGFTWRLQGTTATRCKSLLNLLVEARISLHMSCASSILPTRIATGCYHWNIVWSQVPVLDLLDGKHEHDPCYCSRFHSFFLENSLFYAQFFPSGLV